MNITPKQAQQRKHPDQLEEVWDNLLSRQPELIRAAFASLNPPNQKAVITHLNRMISETGWQPEQQVSAKAAIQALETLSNQDK